MYRHTITRNQADKYIERRYKLVEVEAVIEFTQNCPIKKQVQLIFATSPNFSKSP